MVTLLAEVGAGEGQVRGVASGDRETVVAFVMLSAAVADHVAMAGFARRA